MSRQVGDDEESQYQGQVAKGNFGQHLSASSGPWMIRGWAKDAPFILSQSSSSWCVVPKNSELATPTHSTHFTWRLRARRFSPPPFAAAFFSKAVMRLMRPQTVEIDRIIGQRLFIYLVTLPHSFSNIASPMASINQKCRFSNPLLSHFPQPLRSEVVIKPRLIMMLVNYKKEANFWPPWRVNNLRAFFNISGIAGPTVACGV